MIGFTSFEDAKEFTIEYGGKVKLLHKRDGWHHFEIEHSVHSSLHISSETFGNMYNEFHKRNYENEDVFVLQEVVPFISGFSTFSEIDSFLATFKELWSKIQESNNDEVVITNGYDYYSTELKETMRFHHDTHTYEIGVVLYQ